MTIIPIGLTRKTVRAQHKRKFGTFRLHLGASARADARTDTSAWRT